MPAWPRRRLSFLNSIHFPQRILQKAELLFSRGLPDRSRIKQGDNDGQGREQETGEPIKQEHRPIEMGFQQGLSQHQHHGGKDQARRAELAPSILSEIGHSLSVSPRRVASQPESFAGSPQTLASLNVLSAFRRKIHLPIELGLQVILPARCMSAHCGRSQWHGSRDTLRVRQTRRKRLTS